MCWSIRCMRPHRPSRWSRRRTCRRRGASSTRFTCASRPSRNSLTCGSVAGCGGCATTCSATQTRSTPSTATRHGQPSGRPWNWSIGSRARRVVNWRMPLSAPGKVLPSTTSPPGVRWPRSTAATGISGPNRCSIPAPTASPSSSPSMPRRWISTAGCNGSSTSNSPPPSRKRWRPGCRWASCTTSPSACTPTAPTPGRYRTCWRWGSPRVRRRMSSTN